MAKTADSYSVRFGFESQCPYMLRISEVIKQLKDLQERHGDLFVFQSSDDEGNRIVNVDEIAFNVADDDGISQEIIIIWPGWTDAYEMDW